MGVHINPAGSSTASYKVYSALITQSLTNAPTATVFENTLGGTIVWTRNGLGDYSGTLTGAFPAAKTFLLGFNQTTPASNVVHVGSAVEIGAGALHYYYLQRISDDVIGLLSTNGVDAEDLNNNVFIEIRVYL